MWNRRIAVQRPLALIGALALFLPLLSLTSSPAYAACSGTVDESASVTCSRGGGNNGRPVDTNWTFLSKWADPSCPEGTRATAVRPGTTGPVSNFCLRSNAGTPGLKDTARARVPKPTLETDFKRALLTGAKVTFDVGQTSDGSDLKDKWVRLQDFNNVWLHLQPERFELDFGDGSPTSKWNVDDISAKTKYEHVYTKTSSEVRVTLTVWWTAFIHGNLVSPDPDAPPIDPDDPGAEIQVLGELDSTNTLRRPVVEVWSALTEPNN